MNQVLFGPITVGHVVGAVVILVAVMVLKKVFATKEENVHVVQTRCSCGWMGQVSKYKPVCPKCAKPVRV
ncbi:MAG: hypothetical protein AB2A00_01805 [Myxococcota bacterium]